MTVKLTADTEMMMNSFHRLILTRDTVAQEANYLEPKPAESWPLKGEF
jgi:hypothetical protein